LSFFIAPKAIFSSLFWFSLSSIPVSFRFVAHENELINVLSVRVSAAFGALLLFVVLIIFGCVIGEDGATESTFTGFKSLKINFLKK